MGVLTKIILFVVVVSGANLYLFKDTDAVRSMIVAFYPNKIKIAPGEAIGRAAIRIVEQSKLNGIEINADVILQAYNDALKVKFDLNATVGENNAPTVSKEKYLAAKKSALLSFDFNRRDRNKDGNLSQSELGGDAFAFRGIDLNKDGNVVIDEYWNKHHKSLITQFDKHDINNDSMLNFSEYGAMIQKELSPEEFHKTLDSNDNNIVDHRELNNAGIIYDADLRKTVQS